MKNHHPIIDYRLKKPLDIYHDEILLRAFLYPKRITKFFKINSIRCWESIKDCIDLSQCSFFILSFSQHKKSKIKKLLRDSWMQQGIFCEEQWNLESGASPLIVSFTPRHHLFFLTCGYEASHSLSLFFGTIRILFYEIWFIFIWCLTLQSICNKRNRNLESQ